VIHPIKKRGYGRKMLMLFSNMYAGTYFWNKNKGIIQSCEHDLYSREATKFNESVQFYTFFRYSPIHHCGIVITSGLRMISSV
jgi:hypothetical protein